VLDEGVGALRDVLEPPSSAERLNLTTGQTRVGSRLKELPGDLRANTQQHCTGGGILEVF
jgi:hypothetical protein